MARTLWQFVALAVVAFEVLEPIPALAQARCEIRRQACVSECYARHFTIDPQRAKCIATCNVEDDKCKREEIRPRSGVDSRWNWAEHGQISRSVSMGFHMVWPMAH